MEASSKISLFSATGTPASKLYFTLVRWKKQRIFTVFPVILVAKIQSLLGGIPAVENKLYWCR
jgi:hypothetical protein